MGRGKFYASAGNLSTAGPFAFALSCQNSTPMASFSCSWMRRFRSKVPRYRDSGRGRLSGAKVGAALFGAGGGPPSRSPLPRG